MGRRVLVTGGSGFLGSRVVPLLVGRGDEVSALARSTPAAERVERLGATAVAGDLDDAASTDRAFAAAGAGTLVNLASLGFGHAGTIVAAAEDAGVSRAVFVSTTAIVTSLDAASKEIRKGAEETVRSSALDWTIIRPAMIYGTPDDRNIVRLLRLIRRVGVVPVPGGGHRLQQPVHVDDVAAAVVAATEAEVAIGRAYDVAGPDPLSFRQLIEQAGHAVGRRGRPVPVPLGPAVAAVRVYERLARQPRLKAEQIERLAEDKAFDVGAARTDLGFEPRPFAEGVRQEAAMLP